MLLYLRWPPLRVLYQNFRLRLATKQPPMTNTQEAWMSTIFQCPRSLGISSFLLIADLGCFKDQKRKDQKEEEKKKIKERSRVDQKI